MTSSRLLQLPSEVRACILHHALPVRRLCPHHLRDPEYKRDGTVEGRAIPPLLFACRQLHQEASEIFYSKAILEVAPPKALSFLFDDLVTFDVANALALDLSSQIESTFSFASPRLLVAITRVYIFSDQKDVIKAEAYDCLLRWLLANTNVRFIHLSKRLLCRVRIMRTPFLKFQVPPSFREQPPLRAIQIFSSAGRSEWERDLRRRKETALGQALPSYHVAYARSDQGEVALQQDPRWDARTTDSDKTRRQAEAIGNLLDLLLSRQPQENPNQICYQSFPEGLLSEQKLACILGGCPEDGRPPQAKLYQVILKM